MSYCRFSCNDFKSDVYVFHHCDGFIAIHVAASRHRIRPPSFELLMHRKPLWAARLLYNLRRWASHRAGTVPIAHPLAGKTFTERSFRDALQRCEILRRLGFHVPQHALDGLREEVESGASVTDTVL